MSIAEEPFANQQADQQQVILSALTALRRGDFSVRLPTTWTGLSGKVGDTFNDVMDQLEGMTSELDRISRVVGKEGKIKQRASQGGLSGSWAGSIDSVNALISDLVHPTSEMARVIGAVAKGDLSQSMALDLEGRPLEGEFLRTARTVNRMVDQLGSFASEVTRVAREVGTDGKLGGQAAVKGVAGTWRDLTDSVNSMAGNLTGQVRNIAEVTIAVANGDLSKKITVDVRGEFLELKDTINTMVDQLRSFASEVTRVAREVGTEGKLGGQARVEGVSGTWKDLTDSVNFMAGNLTAQVRNIAAVTTAVATGDLSKKITVDVKGEISELKNTINTMVDQLSSFASEVTRVAREVGTEGKLGGQADVKGVAGTWKDLTDSVNFMAGNLTGQVRNIAEVTKAVASGDLSKKITVDVKGEILELKNTINTMVDQLSSFASEVTRVAREVGTEGKLGGQAQVKGVSGTWKDLTDNVNFMAGNLTGQVRGIARVVTAVANGDLNQKLTVEAKGEIAALADTINSMIATLATFADQVTTVAREVGVEGKLGGQASVPGAAGTWKDLTDNVNQLAANLTTQVRAIAEVATAVTKGDLTRSVKVEAQGEVAALKDNINEMIVNLKDTTLKNAEQDWLKTNLAKFSRMLQGQKDMLTVGRLILSELAPVVSAQHAVFYTYEKSENTPYLTLLASYAYEHPSEVGKRLELGQGLVGQCALENKKIFLQNVPHDYIRVTSGLGGATPVNILVLPVVFEGQVKAVIELASFERFSLTHQAFLDQLTESIGIVLNTIEANMRTENLLKQSQSLAKELGSRQEELQQTNQELQEKARLLAFQNVEVERKNAEVEQARQALEEKAEQLALTSKYKSEFLANMSHELRTPLNSLLILSDQLSKNPDGNLSPKQTEYAKTIHSSGNDLLMLINDILDLSKIESGTVVLDVGELRFADLHGYVERTFRHVAESKSVDFGVEVDASLPRTFTTDTKRLQQVIKNLLSNAFKFTHRGQVRLKVQQVHSGWHHDNEILNAADAVFAFSVTDTGIGIPQEKQQIIFEAFQQADGSTSRKYGGTGLGLAISREIARLLGGEIGLVSRQGTGSTFTLYLPQSFVPQKIVRRQAPPVESPREPSVERKGRVAAEYIPPEDPTALQRQVTDDRNTVQTDDPVLLLVDNDLGFANIELEVVRKAGFKGISTASGAAALALAHDFQPRAVLLDISLPDIDGWRVLRRIKNDLSLRHIPVYIVSTIDHPERGFQWGAQGILAKPIQTEEVLGKFIADIHRSIQRTERRVMMFEPNAELRRRVRDLLGDPQIEFVEVDTGAEALAILRRDDPVDLAVVAPQLPDMSLASFAEQVASEGPAKNCAVLVSTAGRPGLPDIGHWKRIAQEFSLRLVETPEKLVDEAVMLLGRSPASLSEPCRKIIQQLHDPATLLAGKKVLIVDDDIRNIFALTSVLERFNVATLPAETGRDAINLLQSTADIDIVLMDIMMPEMDGIDTMRAIRHIAEFKNLPIVAVTAKAMKGDREKCLEAGAWDYLSKPVDPEKMLSVLCAWLAS